MKVRFEHKRFNWPIWNFGYRFPRSHDFTRVCIIGKVQEGPQIKDIVKNYFWITFEFFRYQHQSEGCFPTYGEQLKKMGWTTGISRQVAIAVRRPQEICCPALKKETSRRTRTIKLANQFFASPGKLISQKLIYRRKLAPSSFRRCTILEKKLRSQVNLHFPKRPFFYTKSN